MDKLTDIKVVSFDGDDTLWDFGNVMRHALRCVIDELEQINPEVAAKLDVEKMIATRNRVAAEVKGKIVNLESIRLEAFRQTLKDVGEPDDDLAVHLNKVYRKHRFENVTLYDDTLPTLNALRERYTIGLLSNGNTYPEHCGLDGMFQFVVFSQDHGVEKPDPGIFEIAVDKAGCSKEAFLHVGDSLVDDIQGAYNAGVRCVWLNRGGTASRSDTIIEHQISTLSQLLDILYRT